MMMVATVSAALNRVRWVGRFRDRVRLLLATWVVTVERVLMASAVSDSSVQCLCSPGMIITSVAVSVLSGRSIIIVRMMSGRTGSLRMANLSSEGVGGTTRKTAAASLMIVKGSAGFMSGSCGIVDVSLL